MIRLFEFEDQWWFPKVFRNGITDYLQYAVNRIDLYEPVIPILKRSLKRREDNVIVDIGSGGGGGIVKIHERLKKEGLDIRVILTDKFPNIDAYKIIEKQSNGEITFREDSIDALEVPKDLKGFRTMFVSLHHFDAVGAKKILENAKRDKVSIGIFEFTERTFLNFMLNFFAPIVVMAAVPFIKPFKWSRFFFTYVLPVIPFSVMWDGFVSVMRTYSVEELEEMVIDMSTEEYKWEIGKVDGKRPISIIYLVGYPVDPDRKHDEC